jgi:hypothetical protein
VSDLAAAARRLENDAKRAVRVTLLDLQAEAVKATSGTLTPADLRRQGHPYAKRHGSPGLNPNVVNVGSGTLRASWETEGPLWDETGTLSGSLFNTDPKAGDWLEPGTATMFARAPQETAAAAVEPRFAKRIEELFG